MANELRSGISVLVSAEVKTKRETPEDATLLACAGVEHAATEFDGEHLHIEPGQRGGSEGLTMTWSPSVCRSCGNDPVRGHRLTFFTYS